MLALYFLYYNFRRIHQTLRVTAAMEAGLTNHAWGIEDRRLRYRSTKIHLFCGLEFCLSMRSSDHPSILQSGAIDPIMPTRLPSRHAIV